MKILRFLLLFFWNFNDAKEYIKHYQEGKTVVVYKE